MEETTTNVISPFLKLPHELIFHILDFQDLNIEFETLINTLQQEIVTSKPNLSRKYSLPLPFLRDGTSLRKHFLVFPNISFVSKGLGNINLTQSICNNVILQKLLDSKYMVPWKHIKRVQFPNIPVIQTRESKQSYLLRILQLKDTDFSKFGVLQSLRVQFEDLTDASIDYLLKCQTLERIELYKTKITQERGFLNLFTQFPRLKSVMIRHFEKKDDDSKVLAAAAATAPPTPVVVFNPASLIASGATTFHNSLPNYDPYNYSIPLLRAVRSRCSPLNAKKRVGAHSRVTELALCNAKNAEALMLFKCCSSLEKLDLSFGDNLSLSSSVPYLTQKNLKYLNLSYNPRIGWNGEAVCLAIASGLPNLKYLVVKACSLSDEAVKWLFQSPSIESLDLSLNRDVTSDAFDNIGKNKVLQKLRLEEIELFEKGYSYISQNTNLVTLELVDCHLTDQRVEALVENTKLADKLCTLNLERNFEISYKSLLSILQTFSNLRKLDLSGCRLGDANVLHALKRPALLSRIVELNLCDNLLTNDTVSQGIIPFCTEQQVALRELNLAKNDGISFSIGIKQLIETCTHIETLHFSEPMVSNVKVYQR